MGSRPLATDQQFGRTSARERAGSTGRAGNSWAGTRLASCRIAGSFARGQVTMAISLRIREMPEASHTLTDGRRFCQGEGVARTRLSRGGAWELW